MTRPGFSEATAFVVALVSVLVVQGAVPFLLAPTMGQAVWTTGFAQSFANDSWLSIYASNFGAPEPAPIAFGLAGAWPASIFIRLGMHAADAYTAMAAFWLTVAFSSAYVIARHFTVGRYSAVLAALCWGTMPVIWAHAGYSMTSLGIGLLSFYFLVVTKLMDSLRDKRKWGTWCLLYLLAAVIAVFMDGYSFMMFAVGSSIIVAVRWIVCGDMALRKRWALTVFPVHAMSFCVAYWLYVLYIGRSGFDKQPIDFFRGWGVDLAFMVFPTEGMHWLPDLLKLSVPRNGDMFWGDASVWITSFSLPLVLAALWSFFKSKQNRTWLLGATCVAVFGFYMALGPSLKINTVKPPDAVEQQSMPERYVIAPTGSALLSENLPGFSVMRASYRWGALGVFGAWLLVVLALSKNNEQKTRALTVGILTAVMLLNLPNPSTNLESQKRYRSMFFEIDHDVLAPLRSDVKAGELVAFLPWRNDFLVNYLAAKLDIKTYNIGGDKNYELARQNWPPTMRDFPMAKPDGDFSSRILKLFAEREADVVIVPYIDMLWAAHHWPHKGEVDLRKQLEAAVGKLAATSFVDITEREHYAVVRLNSKLAALHDEELKSFIYKEVCIAPKCLKVNGFEERTSTQVGALGDGRLHTQRKAGFLTFGPYRPMDGGKYSLVIHGSGSFTDETWVDVVSGKGTVSHGKWALAEMVGRDGMTWSTNLELKGAVRDLEIRIFVGAEDELVLNGYELKPVAERGESL